MNSREMISSNSDDGKYPIKNSKLGLWLEILIWTALILSFIFMKWSSNQVEMIEGKFHKGDRHLLLTEIDIKRTNENMIKKMASITYNQYPLERLEYLPELNKQLISFARSHEIKSVADFGCGKGDYVRNFKKAEFEAVGYDSTSFSTISDDLIKKLDLSQPTELGRQFDLIISINVGQHIFSDYEDNFMANLAKHAKKYIFLSWGVLGQPGYLRVNNRENNYIINKLEKLDFKYVKSQTETLRSKFKNYLSQTIMIFEKQ